MATNSEYDIVYAYYTYTSAINIFEYCILNGNLRERVIFA